MGARETVLAIYDAFGRGDIPAILDSISDDVRWESWEEHFAQDAGVDYLQSRSGKAGVAAFFETVGAFTFHEFNVLDIMANNRQVAVEVVIEATLPSGVRFRDEEIHLWTFDDDDKVVRFRHYLDTAKHIAAAKPSVAASEQHA